MNKTASHQPKLENHKFYIDNTLYLTFFCPMPFFQQENQHMNFLMNDI